MAQLVFGRLIRAASFVEGGKALLRFLELTSAARVHCSSSKANKGRCPAFRTKVALGEVADVATVLLADAEVPCCAAAAMTRDEDKTIREGCMARIRIDQRHGKEETARETSML